MLLLGVEIELRLSLLSCVRQVTSLRHAVTDVRCVDVDVPAGGSRSASSLRLTRALRRGVVERLLLQLLGLLLVLLLLLQLLRRLWLRLRLLLQLQGLLLWLRLRQLLGLLLRQRRRSRGEWRRRLLHLLLYMLLRC